MSSENLSQVAQFVSHCISAGNLKQKDIARDAGFDNPNVITMIKQGRTKVPLAKVGPLAEAMNIDPVYLLKLCLQEYQPETWKAIEPYMSEALTKDEQKLLRALRRVADGPYLTALNSIQRARFDEFMESMRPQPGDSKAIH